MAYFDVKLEEFGGGGGLGEGLVEGPEGFRLIESGVNGKATVVEGELGVFYVHREDLIEEIEVGVDIRELKYSLESFDDIFARGLFLKIVDGFSDGEVGNMIGVTVAHKKVLNTQTLFRNIHENDAHNNISV